MVEKVAAESGQRLRSLDIVRGIVAVCLLSGTYTLFREGFGVGQLAQGADSNVAMEVFLSQLRHSSWEGCTLWDLIMPAFIFLAGVAMPFSYAGRVHRGEAYSGIVLHATLRSITLVILGSVGFIVLGNLIMGRWPKHINVDFSNVLPQIGLSSFFAFFTVGKGLRVQLLVASSILVCDWLLFAVYPMQGAPAIVATTISLPQQPEFEGFFAHWNKGLNVAADFDRWMLNLLPRTDPYLSNSTGMQTLNFIPTIVTLIFGVIVGEMLGGKNSNGVKLSWMIRCGLLGVCSGGGPRLYNLSVSQVTLDAFVGNV